MLRLDPDDRSHVVIVLLHPPSDPGQTLMTQSISTTGQEALRKLEFTSQRVIGEADARSIAKQAAAEMEKSIKRIRRLLVRGEHVVAIFADKQWANFVRESGEWKSDD